MTDSSARADALSKDPGASGKDIWDLLRASDDAYVWKQLVGDPRLLLEVSLAKVTMAIDDHVLRDLVVMERLFDNPSLVFVLATADDEEMSAMRAIIFQWMDSFIRESFYGDPFHERFDAAVANLDLLPVEHLRYSISSRRAVRVSDFIDAVYIVLTTQGPLLPRMASQIYRQMESKPAPFDHLPLGGELAREHRAMNHYTALTGLMGYASAHMAEIRRKGLLGMDVESLVPHQLIRLLQKLDPAAPMVDQERVVTRALTVLRDTHAMSNQERALLPSLFERWGASPPALTHRVEWVDAPRAGSRG